VVLRHAVKVSTDAARPRVAMTGRAGGIVQRPSASASAARCAGRAAA
jgi:hypothetical protein